MFQWVLYRLMYPPAQEKAILASLWTLGVNRVELSWVQVDGIVSSFNHTHTLSLSALENGPVKQSEGVWF